MPKDAFNEEYDTQAVIEEDLFSIAKTGVNYISIGALTHSVQALDIGLDINP